MSSLCKALALLLFALTTMSASAAGQRDSGDDPAPSAIDLDELSLEELMNVEVVSVSKTGQELRHAPAAVYVITRQELRASGARTIADALRFVPGIQAERYNGHEWSVTARGFPGVFSNRLLVLIDGRSVYNPLTSGVYWDLQDTLLTDIERIEVIRGPGGAIWGSNAVQGVINVITRHSADTLGGYSTVLLGTETLEVAARYGARLGDATTYRAFAKFRNLDGQKDSSGADVDDGSRQGRIGLRVDHAIDESSELRLQSQWYTGRADEIVTGPVSTPPYTTRIENTYELSGGHVLGTWSTETGRGTTRVQAYYDVTDLNQTLLRELRHTFDLEVQHEFARSGAHAFMLGFGYRHTVADFDNSAQIQAGGSGIEDDYFNIFFHDAISLDAAERWKLTLGAKMERNDFTGWEFQPDVRAVWTPDETHATWAAVSRAVRLPGRFQIDSRTLIGAQAGPMNLPLVQVLRGDDSQQAENLTAVELGYRYTSEALTIDATAFHHTLDDVVTLRAGTPFFDSGNARTVVPLAYTNAAESEFYGFELSASVQANEELRIQASYSYLDATHDTPNGNIPINAQHEPARHMAHVRTSWTPSPAWEFNTWWSFVEERKDLPSRFRLDARFAWRLSERLDVELVGQNLLVDHEVQTGFDLYHTPSELERAVYARMSIRF